MEQCKLCNKPLKEKDFPWHSGLKAGYCSSCYYLKVLDPNYLAFERFWEDFQSNKFPKLPRPSMTEKKKYTKEQRSMKKRLLQECPMSSDERDTQEKLLANNAIPVKIRIWVNNLMDYYFSDLVRVSGLVHRLENVRKELYKKKGYTYYTISEYNHKDEIW